MPSLVRNRYTSGHRSVSFLPQLNCNLSKRGPRPRPKPSETAPSAERGFLRGNRSRRAGALAEGIPLKWPLSPISGHAEMGPSGAPLPQRRGIENKYLTLKWCNFSHMGKKLPLFSNCRVRGDALRGLAFLPPSKKVSKEVGLRGTVGQVLPHVHSVPP